MSLRSFFVYSRGAIETLAAHDVPHVIISITSDEEDRARLPASEACRGVLRLSFLDADVTTPSQPETSLFSPAQARAIWGFVLAHAPAIERVVLHCDAGQCRSPAVAAALAKALLGDDEEFFRRYRPNMRVYRLMLETYYEAHPP